LRFFQETQNLLDLDQSINLEEELFIGYTETVQEEVRSWQRERSLRLMKRDVTAVGSVFPIAPREP
jgi:hypothetical protein